MIVNYKIIDLLKISVPLGSSTFIDGADQESINRRRACYSYHKLSGAERDSRAPMQLQKLDAAISSPVDIRVVVERMKKLLKCTSRQGV